MVQLPIGKNYIAYISVDFCYQNSQELEKNNQEVGTLSQ